MVFQQINEEEVFKNAAEIPAAEARSAYLKQACGTDEELLKRVLTLLRARDEAPSFLESPPAMLVATADVAVAATVPGTLIGPYKIREQIGEGGMGVVYVAEQSAPVRRKVALKIIRPGMATKDVIGRFEAERQALAMMDHPNIARVFDGGATAAGQPYFVMELVQGLPITEYCDQHRLSTTARLKLFATVCRAVQHAHQRGIIHRDLKPSNIIVAQIDAAAVPKVIDFGVAKAVGPTLTEATVYTHFAQMVGTPLYMSPEQTDLGVLDIDTRSDIYSLGVLLYELLTGSTPFDRETLKRAGYDEMRRIIREDEPRRPSATVSTLDAQALSTLAERRGSDPRKLSQSLAGDLDWIVMKCLEKDRSRRYETASDLAQDIERYLNDEPVEAYPPSAVYRFRKFARRNRGPLLAASLAVVALTLTALGLAASSILIARERNTALAARNEATEHFQLARDAVDKLITRVADDLRNTPQTEALRKALLTDALEFYQQMLKRGSNSPTLRYEVAMAQRRVGDILGSLNRREEAAAAHADAINRLRELSKEFPNTAKYKFSLAETLRESTRSLLSMTFTADASGAESDTIERYGREAVELLEDLNRAYPGNDEYQVLMADAYMSWAPSRRGSGTEEFEALKRANSLLEPLATRPDAAIETRRLYAHLAEKLASIMSGESAKKHYQDSEQLLRDLLQKAPDDERIRSLLAQIIHSRLARFYPHSNEEAVALLEECVKLREGLVDDFPSIPKHRVTLAGARVFLGNSYGIANAPQAALQQLLLAKELLDDLCREYPRHKDMFNQMNQILVELYYRNYHFGSVADWLRIAEEWRDFQLLRAENFGENDSLLGAGYIELNVADALVKKGRSVEAVDWARQGFRRLLGHLETATQEERETSLGSDMWDTARTLSRVIYEPGDTATAVEFREYILRAARLAPTTANAQKLFAMASIEQAQDTQTTPPWDDAAEKFASAIDLSADHGPAWNNPRKAVCRELAHWDQAVDRVAKLRPDEPCLWIGRAQYRALRNRWAEAAADYAKVIHARPIDDDCIAYAGLLLLLDDKVKYQQFCNELVTRFGDSSDDYAGSVAAHDQAASVIARICALGPADDLEPATLLSWAKLGPSDIPVKEFSDGWLGLGLTQYRAGDYDQAIKSLTRSHVPFHVGREQSWFLLAMAHHRLGDVRQAEKCLETAKQLLVKRSPHPDGPADFPAVDWIELQLISREAKALIGAPNDDNSSQVTQRNDEPISSSEP